MFIVKNSETHVLSLVFFLLCPPGLHFVGRQNHQKLYSNAPPLLTANFYILVIGEDIISSNYCHPIVETLWSKSKIIKDQRFMTEKRSN